MSKLAPGQYMPHRRKPASEVTPEYEDAGLFKNKVGQIAVELVPQTTRNSRNDLVVRGFVQGNIEIEVCFAGRRTKEIGPLEAQLRALRSHAVNVAAKMGEGQPDIDAVRLSVMIEGAWRPRFQRDQAGWETRSYFLFAARWSLRDGNGDSVAFGTPPAASASRAVD